MLISMSLLKKESDFVIYNFGPPDNVTGEYYISRKTEENGIIKLPENENIEEVYYPQKVFGPIVRMVRNNEIPEMHCYANG